jgi:hypothetical protein|nr:MAG TPA: baseplate assembly protein [Caudoviricetes sp.]
MQYIGTICEVSSDKSLVRVNYLGVVTKLIPYKQQANSFKRSFSPPRIGEQAIVCELANGGIKYAQGAIFNKGCKEPSGVSQTKEVTEYEDGTIISYDSASSTLEILNAKTINILTSSQVNITTKNANISSQSTTIKSPSILLQGNTTIQGAISTTGAGGGSGTFEIKGNVKINGDIQLSGNITDARGDLTGHTHNDTDGGTSLPR